MKLIILEGTDGAGKTTLFNRFMNDSGSRHFWNLGKIEANMKLEGKALDNWKMHITRLFAETSPADDDVVFTDRSFVGNLIYGRMMKDQLYISEDEIYILFKWLSRSFSEIHVNFLRCSEAKLIETLTERGEDYIDKNNAFQIQREYSDIFISMLNKPRIEGLSIHFGKQDAPIDELYNIIIKQV